MESYKVKKNQVTPFYWNTNVNEITIFINCRYDQIKELILNEDKEAVSIRFGVDDEGTVYFWNGSINHTGICNAIGKYWILTGIYKFDDNIYTSNNRYSQNQLDKEANTKEFQKAFEQLLKFNKNVKEIRMARATIKF